MFYRKKFDYKATVTAVSDALSSVLNLDEIVRKIMHAVRSDMFIDRSGLILVGAGGQESRGYFMGEAGEENCAAEPKGEDRDAIRETPILREDPLVGLLAREKKLVTKYDVAEDPRFADVQESCGDRFAELGASMAIPVLYRGEVKGILLVGHKKSGQFYTREDVELLTTLASHGAVAIENANLAEQMKKEETVRTNLSRYLSPQIVDRIVQNNVQLNLDGDRKVVTVLFSDIRNFTTITESRPPDQLITILNEYFTSMAETVFEQRGSLDKYIGDAIVAVFGSLISLENPARNAVAAAVAMMNRLPELNRRWEERFGFSMNIGIGVNTGEVFLGNIGSPERMEFTVIGDAVNVASRFSGLAKPGQILVTKETLAHLGPDFPVREHPPAEVKGKSGKLEVFEVIYGQSVV
jgi:adenylate cyclase